MVNDILGLVLLVMVALDVVGWWRERRRRKRRA